MELLSPLDWATYRQAINDASATFNHQIITWARANVVLDYNGNDDTKHGYSFIQLECLCNYNIIPSWSVDKATGTGVVDKEGIPIIFNKQYLTDKGYINPNGMMDFNLSADYFILDGLKYKVRGDTQAAQARVDPLLQYFVIVRDNPVTGLPHL
jgi:hypothetical protein